MTTQLEKDVASNAGVIPIWPWLKDGKPKDGLPPNIYANRLLEAKRANGQEGIIKRCDHDGCENDYKAMFWRSTDTPENIVPEGWTDFGGPHHFSECPACRARDLQDIGLDEFMEDGRVDINLKQGSTGSSGTSDRQLRSSRVVPSRSRPIIPIIKNTTRRTNMKLKKEARKLFKNHPEHLKAVLQQIDDDERKRRVNAAEDRKRKKEDEEYYEKRKRKRTGGRRKKRRKTRRKKRRKSRHKKRHRKKRTRRRRK